MSFSTFVISQPRQVLMIRILQDHLQPQRMVEENVPNRAGTLSNPVQPIFSFCPGASMTSGKTPNRLREATSCLPGVQKKLLTGRLDLLEMQSLTQATKRSFPIFRAAGQSSQKQSQRKTLLSFFSFSNEKTKTSEILQRALNSLTPIT